MRTASLIECAPYVRDRLDGDIGDRHRGDRRLPVEGPAPLLRTAGQMMGKVRKMAGEFQGQFNAALREAERELDLEETRKKVEDLKSLNPM